MSELRAATAADHESVDQAFGGFGIGDPDGYRRFLLAHARALPAVEAMLDGVAGPPPLRPRAPLLAADLAALGESMPDPLPFPLADGEAAAFGAAYVIEGSRLGGGLLARTVPEGMPAAYLSDTHLSGEWRGFLSALDERAAGDAAWTAVAIASARATFDLYRQAADATA